MSKQRPTLEHTVVIKATPQTIWNLWTTPEGLCQWWGVNAEVLLEPGGVFKLTMEDGNVMRGEFLDLEPPRRLSFTFGWEGSPSAGQLAPGSTRVEVTITPDDDQTVVVLRHFKLPASLTAAHNEGWTHFLCDRLVEAAES